MGVWLDLAGFFARRTAGEEAVREKLAHYRLTSQAEQDRGLEQCVVWAEGRVWSVLQARWTKGRPPASPALLDLLADLTWLRAQDTLIERVDEGWHLRMAAAESRLGRIARGQETLGLEPEDPRPDVHVPATASVGGTPAPFDTNSLGSLLIPGRRNL